MSLQIQHFFDQPTFTYSYVIWDDQTNDAAILDSVMDYDAASGRAVYDSADELIAFVNEKLLRVNYIMETHVHADHLSAAPYLREKLGGKMVIGSEILTVQNVFGKLFNAGPDFPRDGSQFDVLLNDDDVLELSENIKIRAMHTPGHTPACMSYVVNDEAVFVGDTLFMPDFGTARCDFPGGSAETLYNSVMKLFQLPSETEVYLCHDYLPEGRTEYQYKTTIGEQRANNIHIGESNNKDEFIAKRTARDAQLAMPKLIMPSVQVNMRAGHLPPPEDNGVSYIKIPVNAV